jgi:hypothetical protein
LEVVCFELSLEASLATSTTENTVGVRGANIEVADIRILDSFGL